MPAVTRKTEQGLPRYRDDEASDVFLISDAEDLVPVVGEYASPDPAYRVDRFRPRIEGAFSRIERWTRRDDVDVHWRSISRDNVTTVFGADASSRVSDPEGVRVFSWLMSGQYDDKGNVLQVEYQAEDDTGLGLGMAHERNRSTSSRSVGRYLKRIRYGNRVSRLVDPALTNPGWMFEVVLDYGDHDEVTPSSSPDRPWRGRADPFSDYRAGFEVRTYRACRRILMFHHFADEPEVGDDCLVRSLNLAYRENTMGLFLSSVISCSYRRDGAGYRREVMPRLEFEYSGAEIGVGIRHLEEKSLENLTFSTGTWVDLDGEGIPGFLAQRDGAWYYKPNLGAGQLGPMREVAAVPAGVGQTRLLDLAGDGRIDIVSLEGPAPGYMSRRPLGGWDRFTPFESLPVLDWEAENLRFVDLDGDGHADVLVTDPDLLTWYPSRAERGFGQPAQVRVPDDDERGPRLVFADGTSSVYLADMSGDGLADLVRIANGSICYWPNLGYGRFGAKVTMDLSPLFDRPEAFDQRRIRLVDVDGNGLTDVLYLGASGVTLYANQSGNLWSGPMPIEGLAYPGETSDVSALDLLGTGTGCLVEFSPLPGRRGRAVRYLDLHSGRKPHLLTVVRNNLGAETRITYASSTAFYLADRAAGRPWATRLPFPVHVVERIETIDHLSHTRTSARFAYHHGYFDGVEREFRGFGMVEQWDTDQIEALSDTALAPVLTRTWYHTGAYVDGDDLAAQFAKEFWREPGAERSLPESVLPDGLTTPELLEAHRALKGSPLRQEVYALDGSPAQSRPYQVTHHSYHVRLLQGRGSNRHAVFHPVPREAVELHHERALYPVEGAAGTATLADPRVSHQITLDVDPYGNVLRAVWIGYGRRHPDADLDPGLDEATREALRAEQGRLQAVLTENRFTNPVEEPHAYRTPLTCEAQTFELTAFPAPASGAVHGFDAVLAAAGPTVGRRLLSHSRTLYRRDDLSEALAVAEVQALALPYESYQLAFTAEQIQEVYGDLLPDPAATLSGAGYLADDAGWWIRTGRTFLAPQDADEAANARAHFYMARRVRDPFGQESTVDYDRYDLQIVATRDALGNETAVETMDYRVLAPRVVRDANGNRSAVAFDVRGMVVGTAVMGKPGELAGDTLDGFETDLDATAYLASPLNDPHAVLQGATTRMVYDLFAYERTAYGDDAAPQPPVVATLSRATHVADLAAGEPTRIHQTFAYSDGFGRVIQSKGLAERGRWAATGWTIFDGKGRPVRTYQPFLTATHRFQFARTVGVSPVLCYDPTGRVVATLTPDRGYAKVVFDPWRQATWDASDTVLTDPRTDEDVAGAVAPALAGEPPDWRTWYQRRIGGELGEHERVAAVRAAAHAGTPAVAYLDSLGRTIVAVAHNRAGATDELLAHRVVLDVEGREREVYDALGRLVMRYDSDLAGRRIGQASMEAGRRWTLPDAAGVPLLAWDSRGFRHRTEYDALRRPVERWVRQGSGPERLRERIVYGEAHPEAARRNLRTRACLYLDGAGMVTVAGCNFKGNPTSTSRRLGRSHRGAADWTVVAGRSDADLLGAPPDDLLGVEVFTTATRVDALNRPVETLTPDTSVTRREYNDAGLLESVKVQSRGAPESTFVRGIDYDAHGRRTSIDYGNGVRTEYRYDPLTLRLAGLTSTRGQDHPLGERVVQDLAYTYDPVGNLTRIADGARQVVFYAGQVVPPVAEYTYDATYRLITATGREHRGQTGTPQPTWNEEGRVRLAHPQDGQAMRVYSQYFAYDRAGNLQELAHRAAQGDWTRTFEHREPSLLNRGETNNRLSSSRVSGITETFDYDEHGNLTAMPHLPTLVWDEQDHLERAERGSGAVRFAYDATGERIRKVVETPSGALQSERLYLGGSELYREYDVTTGAVTLERETLHVMDDHRRIALVETRSQGADRAPARMVRYQMDNHLGSACVELDDVAALVSYEEYHPYGTTSYQAVRSQMETPKRYRYTGKERDEETGLAYHSARHYAPWLARWTACDPRLLSSGINLYHGMACSPISIVDPDGRTPKAAVDQAAQAIYNYVRSEGAHGPDRPSYTAYLFERQGGGIFYPAQNRNRRHDISVEGAVNHIATLREELLVARGGYSGTDEVTLARARAATQLADFHVELYGLMNRYIESLSQADRERFRPYQLDPQSHDPNPVARIPGLENTSLFPDPANPDAVEIQARLNRLRVGTHNGIPRVLSAPNGDAQPFPHWLFTGPRSAQVRAVALPGGSVRVHRGGAPASPSVTVIPGAPAAPPVRVSPGLPAQGTRITSMPPAPPSPTVRVFPALPPAMTSPTMAAPDTESALWMIPGIIANIAAIIILGRFGMTSGGSPGLNMSPTLMRSTTRGGEWD